MKAAPADITGLLVAWGNGDRAALETLVPLVQQELRRVASRQMARERPGHLLQPTALVNEVYIRLVDWKNVQWQNRTHFFAVAAGMMRRAVCSDILQFVARVLVIRRQRGWWVPTPISGATLPVFS